MQTLPISKPFKAGGIGSSLAAMVLAGLIPLLAFAGIVVYLFADQYQTGVRERLIGVAQSTSIAIDRELNHQIAVLQSISESNLFDKAQFAHLYADLKTLHAQEGWVALTVVEAATNRQIMNTAVPMGTVLPPPAHPESLDEVERSRQPRIVGILPHGSIQFEPFVLIRVPVLRHGEVKYTLSLSLSPDALNSIVAKQRLPSDSVIAVLDPRMHIAARNRAQAQFVGTPATRTLTEKIEAAEHGMFSAQNKEGHTVYTVFRKSPETGWAVVIGIPAALIDEPFLNTMTVIGTIGFALLTCGIVLALLFGRAISKRRKAEDAFEAAKAELAEKERMALIAAKEQAQRDSEAKGASLKSVEAKLIQAQKLEAVGQLTGGLAHDFNNLLLVIIGNAEMITALPPGSAEAKQAAALIQDAAERGAELTHRLLAFARKQMLEPAEIDLNQIVENMEQLLRRTLGETVEIETRLAADLHAALADPAQVESALLNLAINARDAMPEGGRLLIETNNVLFDGTNVGTTDEIGPGAYAVISVSDTGSGMSPEIASRAFEPFFTTKEVGKGSGLGLSMIYGFAKQSGGHVRIYSEVGVGTTVRLYLPSVLPSEQQAAVKAGQIPEALSRGEVILLVEDAPLVRETASKQLRALGYEVIEAESGLAALQALERRSGKVDLLFTDMIMAGMSGRDLAAEVRHRMPGLRVLFTSGYTGSAVTRNSELESSVPLLQKPYRRADLAKRVREALDSAPFESPSAKLA